MIPLMPLRTGCHAAHATPGIWSFPLLMDRLCTCGTLNPWALWYYGFAWVVWEGLLFGGGFTAQLRGSKGVAGFLVEANSEPKRYAGQLGQVPGGKKATVDHSFSKTVSI